VSRPYVVNVAEVLRRPGSQKSVQLAVPAGDDLVVGDVRVPAGADVETEADIESLTDGLVVTGHITAPWEGVCRRCLGVARGQLDIEVRELYQTHLTSEDAYPLEGELLDLAPMVRETLMLDLPLAPVCSDDCLGLCPVCGINRNEATCDCDTAPSDPRWAALDVLKDRLDPPGSSR
jgi:uncharacterized protein